MCCGRGTTTPGSSTQRSPGRLAGRRAFDRASRRRAAVYFQYVGTSVLTVYGPISGKSYRFGYGGAVLGVDPRDQYSLETVPKLRRVAAPEAPPGDGRGHPPRDSGDPNSS